jgi:Beta-ketoacyl synthase, N-terminal domain
MNGHTLFIDGIALWSRELNSWAVASAALRGEAVVAPPAATTTARPAPALMAPNERRRAPDAVLLALEVAAAAVAASGHDAEQLASVFTSAHGDLAVTDALCQTLANDPLLLSPTRFHHSVHNAASGYWAIATGCQAASTALAAFEHSFAAGLLEAACQCASSQAPVLLVGYDTEATGPLASVNTSRGLLGVALVLSTTSSAASLWQLQWSLADGACVAPALQSAAAQARAHNAMADALPLFEALAAGQACELCLPLAGQRQLLLRLSAQNPARANAALA